MAPRFGVAPTITEAAVSEGNIGLALGNRCISIGHKTQVTNSPLLALSEAGVTYISTRSVGYNHIDVEYAEAVGISVETVAYSPDRVADYTLMLILSVVPQYRRASTCDFANGLDARRENRKYPRYPTPEDYLDCWRAVTGEGRQTGRTSPLPRHEFTADAADDDALDGRRDDASDHQQQHVPAGSAPSSDVGDAMGRPPRHSK
jgi:hypothetical protein